MAPEECSKLDAAHQITYALADLRAAALLFDFCACCMSTWNFLSEGFVIRRENLTKEMRENAELYMLSVNDTVWSCLPKSEVV